MSDDNNVDIHLRGHVSGVKEAAAETKDTLRDLKQGVVDNAEEMKRATAIGAGMGVMFGVLAVEGVKALGSVAERAIMAGDAMNDLGKRTGESIATLASYELLAEQNGTSVQAMTTAMRQLSRYMVEHNDKLKEIGVTAKTSDDAMRQLAEIVSGMESPTLRTALAMEVFGRNGTELLPLLSGGAKAFDEAKEKTAAYGAALERNAPLADAFNDRLAEMGMHGRTFGQSMAESLLPSLNAVAEYASSAAEGASKFSLASEAAKVVAETLAITGANVAFVFRGVGTEIGGIAAQLAALARGDIEGFKFIGEEMKRDAAAARAELDSFERKVMGADSVAEQAAKNSGDQVSAIEGKVRGILENTRKTREVVSDLDRMLARGQKNELDAYYETGGEETMREVAAKREIVSLRELAKAAEDASRAELAFGISLRNLDEAYARDNLKTGMRDMPQAQRELAEAMARVSEQADKERRHIADRAAAMADNVAVQEKAKQSLAELAEKEQQQLELTRAQWEAQQKLNASWSYGADNALRKYKDSAANVAGQTESAFLRAYSSIEDAAVKSAMGQKVSWRDMANSMIADMIRIQARAAISSAADNSGSWLKTALSWLTGSGGSGGYSGSASGSYADMDTSGWSTGISEWHSGGVIGADAAPRIRSVHPGTFFGAPRYHGGGLVDGEVPIIAKKGEGVFTPEQMKALGGDTIQISVSVDASGTKVQGDNSAGNDIGRRIGAAVRSVLLEEKRPGGLLSAT